MGKGGVMEMVDIRLQSGEAAELVSKTRHKKEQVSERSIRHLAENNVLCPETNKFGKKRIRRYFHFTDLVEAGIAYKLGDFNIPVNMVRMALEDLREKDWMNAKVCLLILSPSFSISSRLGLLNSQFLRLLLIFFLAFFVNPSIE